MKGTVWALLVVSSVAGAASAADEPKRLLVMDIAHSADTKADFARTITELVTARIDEVTEYRTVSGAEIRNLVALEGQKAAVGCDDASCLAEVAGAMGASFVVFGRLSRLGNTLVLQLGLFDAERAEAVERETLKAGSIDEVARSLDAAVDELVGVKTAEKKPPPPEPASGSALPLVGYTVAGVGGAALVAGGLLATVGLSTTADVAKPTADRKAGQGMSWTGIGVGAVGALAVAGGLVLAMGGGE